MFNVTNKLHVDLALVAFTSKGFELQSSRCHNATEVQSSDAGSVSSRICVFQAIVFALFLCVLLFQAWRKLERGDTCYEKYPLHNREE